MLTAGETALPLLHCPCEAVSRVRSHNIPGALSILKGTVPGRVRGSGHMVPTYFRRELRDRVLQRRLRPRTSLQSLCLSDCWRHAPLPAEHPVSRGFLTHHDRSSELDHLLSRVMTRRGDSAMAQTARLPTKADLRAAALAKRDA